jgi:hypothetical protein
VFWLVLVGLRIGSSPSLSNLIEMFFVSSGAVSAAYMKFLVFDKVDGLQSQGNALATALLVLTTLGLRLLMPALPE